MSEYEYTVYVSQSYHLTDCYQLSTSFREDKAGKHVSKVKRGVRYFHGGVRESQNASGLRMTSRVIGTTGYPA